MILGPEARKIAAGSTKNGILNCFSMGDTSSAASTTAHKSPALDAALRHFQRAALSSRINDSNDTQRGKPQRGAINPLRA
jgi:hypothetical protein